MAGRERTVCERFFEGARSVSKKAPLRDARQNLAGRRIDDVAERVDRRERADALAAGKNDLPGSDPPGWECSIPRILPTVAPVPAPRGRTRSLPPRPPRRPGAHGRIRIRLDRLRRGRRERPRPRWARAGPMEKADSLFSEPPRDAVRGARPNALPPVRPGVNLRHEIPGREDSRLARAWRPPRTSTAAIVPGGGRTTVQPVRRTWSLA
jgi:hypothetical protein